MVPRLSDHTHLPSGLWKNIFPKSTPTVPTIACSCILLINNVLTSHFCDFHGVSQCFPLGRMKPRPHVCLLYPLPLKNCTCRLWKSVIQMLYFKQSQTSSTCKNTQRPSFATGKKSLYMFSIHTFWQHPISYHLLWPKWLHCLSPFSVLGVCNTVIIHMKICASRLLLSLGHIYFLLNNLTCEFCLSFHCQNLI
jgi:hypothetical protein